MQQTRLNSLVTETGSRLGQFFGNPWRRVALLLISLLLGMFVGQAVVTTAGQDGQWDVSGAVILAFFVEWISRFAYHSSNRRVLWLEVLNIFKIGMVYSLFLEAFKIGS
jgi:hypothetical protein